MIPTIRVLSCLALLLLGGSAAGAPPPFPGAAKNYKAWTLASRRAHLGTGVRLPRDLVRRLCLDLEIL